MYYINRLEAENKGLELTIKELKKENRKLEKERNILKNVDLALARISSEENEKYFFKASAEKRELQNKLTEAEKQIKSFKDIIKNLTEKNKELEQIVEQNNQQKINLDIQPANTDLQDLITYGLNFLTKAMTLNQSNIQKIK